MTVYGKNTVTSLPRPSIGAYEAVAGAGVPYGKKLPRLFGESTGQPFYIDEAAGNDLNDGLTPATAWASLGPLSDSLPAPGAPPWVASRSYNVGDLVIEDARVKSVSTARYATTGPTEPNPLMSAVSGDLWVSRTGSPTTATTVWQPSHVYGSGYLIAGGRVFGSEQTGTGTSGTTEPNWASATGFTHPNLNSHVLDGTVLWVCYGPYMGVWQPNHTYDFAAAIDPLGYRGELWFTSSHDGYIYETYNSQRLSGMSGATAPVWRTDPERAAGAESTVDNQLIWDNQGPVAEPGIRIRIIGNFGGDPGDLPWDVATPDNPFTIEPHGSSHWTYTDTAYAFYPPDYTKVVGMRVTLDNALTAWDVELIDCLFENLTANAKIEVYGHGKLIGGTIDALDLDMNGRNLIYVDGEGATDDDVGSALLANCVIKNWAPVSGGDGCIGIFDDASIVNCTFHRISPDPHPPAWQPSTIYPQPSAFFDPLDPSVVTDPTGQLWRAAGSRFGTTGAVFPTWSGAYYNVNYDGELGYQRYNRLAWLPFTAYSTSSSARGLIRDGSFWFLYNDGTSGSAEPDWTTVVPGGVINDGTARWQRWGPWCGDWIANHEFEFLSPNPDAVMWAGALTHAGGDPWIYVVVSSSDPMVSGTVEPSWVPVDPIGDPSARVIDGRMWWENLTYDRNGVIDGGWPNPVPVYNCIFSECGPICIDGEFLYEDFNLFHACAGLVDMHPRSGPSFTSSVYRGGHSLDDTDPLFTNAAAGDLSLHSTSPARGAGHPEWALPNDVAGVARGDSAISPMPVGDRRLATNEKLAVKLSVPEPGVTASHLSVFLSGDKFRTSIAPVWQPSHTYVLTNSVVVQPQEVDTVQASGRLWYPWRPRYGTSGPEPAWGPPGGLTSGNTGDLAINGFSYMKIPAWTPSTPMPGPESMIVKAGWGFYSYGGTTGTVEPDWVAAIADRASQPSIRDGTQTWLVFAPYAGTFIPFHTYEVGAESPTIFVEPTTPDGAVHPLSIPYTATGVSGSSTPNWLGGVPSATGLANNVSLAVNDGGVVWAVVEGDLLATDQVVRGKVWSPNGDLVATGDEFTVTAGQQPRWVEAPLPPGTPLVDGCFVGLHGGPGHCISVYGDADHSANTQSGFGDYASDGSLGTGLALIGGDPATAQKPASEGGLWAPMPPLPNESHLLVDAAGMITSAFDDEGDADTIPQVQASAYRTDAHVTNAVVVARVGKVKPGDREPFGAAPGLLMRVQAPGGSVSGYLLKTTSNGHELHSLVGGADTLVVTWPLRLDPLQAGDWIRMQVVGSEISVAVRRPGSDWQDVGVVTNSTVTGAGSVGIAVDTTPEKVSAFAWGALGWVPLDAAYTTPVGLTYWYRLGESTPWPTGPSGSTGLSVPNFALDSSGNNHHLTATNSWQGGTIALPTGDPNLPVTGITGALAPGSADDGGIQFKWYESTSTFYSCWLAAGGGQVIEPNTRAGAGSVGLASTFAAWLAFMPPPGGTPASGIFSIISTWSRSFGIGNYGSKIGFNLATGALNYHVGSLNVTTEFDFSTAPFAPGEWHHFVTQIVRLGTSSYRRRIYLDAELVFEITGDLAAIGNGCENQAGLTLGGGNSNDIWSVHGGGKIDEVAYWTSELTQAQITELWNARVL